MNKDAKAMKYAIEPIRKILQSEAVSDGGTQKKAEELGRTWIRLNEYEYVLYEDEDDKITRVYNDGTNIGCACDRFKDSGNLICEHILALRYLKSPPQLTIENPDYRWLRTYLSSLKWYAENRYLYPPIDPATNEPEIVAELPPDEDSWKPDEDESEELDPMNEDKPLDTGVADEPELKMIERKCHYCGFVELGEDRERVVYNIAEHQKTCPKNPANKKKPATPETAEQPQDPVVKESLTTDAKSATVEKPPKEVKTKVNPPSKKSGSLFDWIEELIEFGVGQIFGDTGTAKTAFARKLAEQAADEGKKVVYWDTEGNMTRKQRAAMTEHKNITYILDRDWDHIKNMLSADLSKGSPKLGVCDLFILDSIGVPVLGIYGTLKQNQKGNALQAMQGLLYQLTTFAEAHEAVVVVTNQPVSEMNKTELEKADRHPFGDKAMFFTKEILKIVVAERNEYMTKCQILAWRSRSAGRGKLLCTVTVSDRGVEVTPTGGE